MFRVLITDNLADAGIEVLENAPDIEVDRRSGLVGDGVEDLGDERCEREPPRGLTPAFSSMGRILDQR